MKKYLRECCLIAAFLTAVQVCDATKIDSSKIAGLKTKSLTPQVLHNVCKGFVTLE